MERNDLITSNMNLVYYIIHKCYPTYGQDEDIHQIGMIGLCKAADNWDESKGTFSTFASKCIRNEIRMEFRRRSKEKCTLSLDYPVELESGETTTFGELIVGEDDIESVDLDLFYDRLTDRQREVFELASKGLKQQEIADEIGINRSWVSRLLKQLRKIWREVYGN